MKSKKLLLTIIPVFVIGLFGNTAFAVNTVNTPTSILIDNTAPSFSAGPSDGSSSGTTPTNAGSNVTFTATAHDSNLDQYYLAICKTQYVKPSASAAPSCCTDAGLLTCTNSEKWAISSATDSDSPATVTYTTSSGDAQSNNWYAFLCDNNSSGTCSASSQGAGDTGSPFKVNHVSNFSNVKIGPSCGSSASVAPGNSGGGFTDFFCVQSAVSDTDTDTAADTVSMYVCSTNSFVSGTCGGTILCSVTGVASGSNAECNAEHLVPIPTAHGSNDVYIFIKDSHGFQGTGTALNSYSVTDVAPVVMDYAAITPPAPPAGGSDSVSFTATIYDDNGYNDITGASGVFFDDTAIDLSSGSCTASDNNCIQDSACTLNSGGSGNELTSTCNMTVWYNADYSDGWKAHLNPSDQTTTVTASINSSAVSNPSLLGIEVVETGISYGTVAIGGSSVSQTTTMENKGNQIIDVLIDGDQMCNAGCTYNIPVGQQKWSSLSAFDWDTSGYALVDTSSTPTAATGCYSANIGVRSSHTSNATDSPIYWKMKVPSSQHSGSYTGQNTFTAAVGGTCTP